MDTSICVEMNWPVPAENEILILVHNARQIGTLQPASHGKYEGVYLTSPGYGVSNACCSIVGSRSTQYIRAVLASKLFANARNLKKGEVKTLIAMLPGVTVSVERVA